MKKKEETTSDPVWAGENHDIKVENLFGLSVSESESPGLGGER